MEFRAYQRAALETDQTPGNGEKNLVVPLLGLAGESGSLLTEYKKLLRDGPAYKIFRERISEELGDILWYLTNIASKAGLDLDDIAGQNLRKIRDRWSLLNRSATLPGINRPLLDEHFPTAEQLPRHFELAITEIAGNPPRVQILLNGEKTGATLTDNAYEDDGYRFHDVFHFAYAAVLGWSPVVRAITKRKRRSDTRVDEIEDGGRAAVIEEAVSAIIFDYARQRSFLDGVHTLDFDLLQRLKSLTSHLEVSASSMAEWESSVLQGFQCWRAVVQDRGGVLIGNLRERSIKLKR